VRGRDDGDVARGLPEKAHPVMAPSCGTGGFVSNSALVARPQATAAFG
jgi:hypothetical protein